MLIKVYNISPKRIKGYEQLMKLNDCLFSGVSSHVTHFVYNLHSVSFTVFMMPSPRQLWWGENACVLKIRCENASVHYDDYGYCTPALKELLINEWDNTLLVSLTGYADIKCSGIVAKVEMVSFTNPDLPCLGNLV